MKDKLGTWLKKKVDSAPPSDNSRSNKNSHRKTSLTGNFFRRESFDDQLFNNAPSSLEDFFDQQLAMRNNVVKQVKEQHQIGSDEFDKNIFDQFKPIADAYMQMRKTSSPDDVHAIDAHVTQKQMPCVIYFYLNELCSTDEFASFQDKINWLLKYFKPVEYARIQTLTFLATKFHIESSENKDVLFRSDGIENCIPALLAQMKVEALLNQVADEIADHIDPFLMNKLTPNDENERTTESLDYLRSITSKIINSLATLLENNEIIKLIYLRYHLVKLSDRYNENTAGASAKSLFWLRIIGKVFCERHLTKIGTDTYVRESYKFVYELFLKASSEVAFEWKHSRKDGSPIDATKLNQMANSIIATQINPFFESLVKLAEKRHASLLIFSVISGWKPWEPQKAYPHKQYSLNPPNK